MLKIIRGIKNHHSHHQFFIKVMEANSFQVLETKE